MPIQVIIQPRRKVSGYLRVLTYHNNKIGHYFEIQFSMPRRPLAQINGNKTNRKELTTYTRGLIIGKHESGVSMTHISQTLGIPLSTVSETIKKNPERINGESIPRSGRPRSYTERDRRHIIRIIRRDPFITYPALRLRAGLDIS